MTKRNIVSFNVLLNLYGLYRRSDNALQCFNQMSQQGHQPDEKTFVLLLYALSQTPTKINDTKRIFSLVEPQRRGPMLTAAMIDALKRANLNDEVEKLSKNFLFDVTKMNDENLVLFDHLFSQIYQHGGLNDRLTTIDELFSQNDRLRSILSNSFYEKSSGIVQNVRSDGNRPSECHALDEAMKIHEKTSIKSILIGTNHRLSAESYEYFKKHSQNQSKRKFIVRDSKNMFLFSNGSCSIEILS